MKIRDKIFSCLPIICSLLLLIDFYLIFVFSPEESTQGLVQKIFYFHVSCAFAMYFGFALAGLFSFLYILKRNPVFDDLSHAGSSVGLLFCTMVLMSGPIWAKPIWGAWWTWDPRLTTTLLVWLIFFACLLLRRFFDNNSRGPLYASILTLFGILDLPLIFLSVKLWRGVHPSVLGKESNMPVEMKITLIFSNVVILCFFITLFWMRARLLGLERKSLQVMLNNQEGN